MSKVYLKRYEAVFLCLHPRGPKMSTTAAARYSHMSHGFVRTWIARYKHTQAVDDVPGRGRLRETTERQDKRILNLFRRKPELTLRQGLSELAKMNIKVSLMTLRQRLLEAGVAYRSTIAKPLLSDKHREKRMEWAQKNIDRDWSKIVFTDESSFYAWVPRKKGWSLQKDRVVERTVKHPAKLHVWGCFSIQGFGTLCLFTENLDARRMIRLYQKGLLPSVRRWFGENSSDWLLQEDNDPKHRSRLCTTWKEENKITTLDWPSQSPDANPIENVWAIMKQKLRFHRSLTIKQLNRNIRKIWRSLPLSYAENLVTSMEKRCQNIIDNNGDWTLY